MLKYYKSKELGEFRYDDSLFEMVDNIYGNYLHYIGSGMSVDLPEGCINTRYMFSLCELPEGFTLGKGFNDGTIIDTSFMFSGCKIPKGFSLENKLNTTNVKDMHCMFRECKMPEGFSLGNTFDTSNVVDMSNMFALCDLPEGFSLGDKFDTRNVTDMRSMFDSCKLPSNFTLGSKFDTSNVVYMSNMFTLCNFPEGFSLGDKFDTSNVTDMRRMTEGLTFRKVRYKEMIKHVDNINDYVLDLVKAGAPVQSARKSATVVARPGVVGETVTTEIDKTENKVLLDEKTGKPGWVVTNPGGESYIVKDSVFTDIYEATGNKPDEYRKKAVQILVYCDETVEFTPAWGGSFTVEAGGYFTVNGYNDLAGVQKDAYEQTYQVLSSGDADRQKAISILTNSDELFNKEDYLKDYLSILPAASVAACVTKEDCDALIERLGIKR